MTKVLIISGALLLQLLMMPFSVSAQEKAKLTPEQRAQRTTRKFTAELKLTDEQSNNIYNVFLKQAQSVDALKAKTDQEKPEYRAEMKSIRTATDGELKKILTADQYNRWIEYRKEQKQKQDAKKAAGPEDTEIH